MTRISGTVLILLFSATTVLSQQSATPVSASNPCTAAQQKQLDFWVGEWNLTWPGEKAGETGHGTTSMRRMLDGCVVQETFSGGDSMHLRGSSVSIFDSTAGKWKQT